MILALRSRDLLLVSWEADPDQIARTLPAGLAPAEVGGRHLVTLAALRHAGGRLGPLPVPPFAQLNIRAYVEREREPAVFFVSSRVTWPGMGGAFLGAPYRPARIRVRPGGVEAPGLGVSVAYEAGDVVEPGPLGGHLLGLYEAAGVRAFRIRRGAAEWRSARPTGPVRADPLRALGFELAGPPELLYAPQASFEAELPPRRV